MVPSNEETVSLATPPYLLQALRKEWDDRLGKMSNDFKEQMKTSREHYELMHKQIEEIEKLQKVTEIAIGTLAPHGIYGGGILDIV